MNATTTKITAATIGNGKAVHAVQHDSEYRGILTVTYNGKQFAASTLCGQTAGLKGYRKFPNQDAEREVTCLKCKAALAKRQA